MLFLRCGLCGPIEAGFLGGAACKCDTHKALDFPTFWFGTRRSMVQIHSPRPLLSVEVPHCVRDFACGLRRPQDGSSSNPFAPTNCFDLTSRSPALALALFLCGFQWQVFSS